MASGSAPIITSGISKLDLQPAAKLQRAGQGGKAGAKKKVADSWEDDDLSSDSDVEAGSSSSPARQGGAHRDGISAPPPTPIAPNYSMSRAMGSSAAPPAFLGSIPDEDMDAGSAGQGRRPEKTDAVARRMISGALGLKAPKMTDEQKAYDKAMKEKERKKRDQEREAERRRAEEAEKARVAIWED